MSLVIPDLEHFVAFARHLTTDQRQPLIIEPFQRVILGDYFAGVQETLVLIPKKNGKTTLMAAVALHHLLYVPDAEVYIAASSANQAAILYGFAKRFVNRSPALQKRCIVRGGTREIRSRRDDGMIRVLAADADTADGVGPTLAIVDELHRHKRADLYDVFSDGLDARDGRMLTISTAGSDEDTPLGRMRAKTVAEGTISVDGRYRYVRKADGGFAMHEWALIAGEDDLDDLDVVKRVNPLKSMTKAKLRRRQKSPSMTSTRWQRLACNIWAQEEDAAISALDWSPCGDDDAGLPAGTRQVVIGIDLGWTKDTTAIVPVGILDDEEVWFPREAFKDPDEDEDEEIWRDLPEQVGRATIHPPVIIAPPGDGSTIREDVIKDALRDFAARWPTAVYALDPNADGQTIAQWIETELCGGDAERVRVVAQQPVPMSKASMLVAAHVRLRAIIHPGVAALTAQILAAWARPVGARWRFDKHPKLKKPIDGAIALAIGLRVLRAPAPKSPKPFVIAGRRR